MSKLHRRSFLGRLVGAAATGGGAAGVVLGGASASAQAYTGQTDSDPTDASGYGRGTQLTDSDPTDAAGNGRRGY